MNLIGADGQGKPLARRRGLPWFDQRRDGRLGSQHGWKQLFFGIDLGKLALDSSVYECSVAQRFHHIDPKAKRSLTVRDGS